MALVFHDGFETGGADAWSNVTGTPTFIAGAAHTGGYGMRCNTSSAIAYVSYHTVDNSDINCGVGFYLRIASAPSVDCDILGEAGIIDDLHLKLTDDRHIEVWYDGTLRDTSNSQLSTEQWYRIAVSMPNSGNRKLWIDGTEECSWSTGSTYIRFHLGVLTSCNADLYFDDIWFDSAHSIATDNGDIRTLAARPIGEGTDQDTATAKADGWVDNTESAVAVFGELDSDPPVITSYNLFDGGGTARYSVTMDECGSGNLAGIGGSDTIEAVNFLWYYKTEGGGTNDYGSKIIVSDGTLTNDNIDDPKDPTWLQDYHADTPSGANAWTQAYVNSIEMGMAGITPGSKGIWFYEAYAMVAFKVASGGQNITRTVNDSLGITDTRALVREVLRTFDESMGVTDVDSRAWDAIRTEAESLGITDSVTGIKGIIRSVADSLGITDTFSKEETKIVSDSLGITDAVSRICLVLRTITETLGITDTPSRVWTAVREVADNIGLTDTGMVWSRGIAVGESLGISDDTVRTSIILRTFAESLGLTDEAVRVCIAIRSFAESLGLTDSREVLFGLLKFIDDDIGLTDTFTKVHIALRTLSETVGLTDAITRVFNINRIISDSEGITDGQALQRLVTVTDSLGVTDDVVKVIDYLRTQEETIGLVDSMARILVISRTISDDMDISDEMSEQLGSLIKAAWAFIIIKQTQN